MIFPAILVGVVQWAGFGALLYCSIAGPAFLLRKLMRRKLDHMTIANIIIDENGCATIPVLVTFTGVRGLPWWYGVATNNAKPLLAIEPDAVCFRVVRKQRRRFGDIECADIRQASGTVNLELSFHGALLTFSANLGSVPLAAHVLGLLPASVPLSERAVAIMNKRV